MFKYSSTFITLNDLNNDGTLDMILISDLNNIMVIRFGCHDGTFESQMTYSVSLYPNCVAIADFNHDSKKDAAVVNWGR